MKGCQRLTAAQRAKLNADITRARKAPREYSWENPVSIWIDYGGDANDGYRSVAEAEKYAKKALASGIAAEAAVIVDVGDRRAVTMKCGDLHWNKHWKVGGLSTKR